VLTRGEAVARPTNLVIIWGLYGNPTCLRYNFHFARGQCYAHVEIWELCGRFGNRWGLGGNWPGHVP